MRLKSLKLNYEKGCISQMTSRTSKWPSAYQRLKSTALRREQIKLRAHVWRKREEVTAVEICLMRSSIVCTHSRNSVELQDGVEGYRRHHSCWRPRGRDHYLKNNLGSLVPWNSFVLQKVFILIKLVIWWM